MERGFRELFSLLSLTIKPTKEWAAAALNHSRKISANKHAHLESSPRGHGAQARDLAYAPLSWK